MQNEESPIINRVAQSRLETLDINDLLPHSAVVSLDLMQFMNDGILREKAFREQVKNFDWAQYQNKWVNVWCSEDVIIPLWTYMIVGAELSRYALGTVSTTPEQASSAVILRQIDHLDFTVYAGKPIVLKGCNRPDVGPEAYIALSEKLSKVAGNLMFGEACSTVPVFKPGKK
jgi:hypothetical protein